jgi:fusion and transport protein UGO1
MAVIASPQYRLSDTNEPEAMVEIGPYKGVIGTMWSIVREEGTSQEVLPTGGAKAIKKRKRSERKGQGVPGLWRGWRVGMWGLVGVWSARAMSGSGSSGGEF